MTSNGRIWNHKRISISSLQLALSSSSPEIRFIHKLKKKKVRASWRTHVNLFDLPVLKVDFHLKIKLPNKMKEHWADRLLPIQKHQRRELIIIRNIDQGLIAIKVRGREYWLWVILLARLSNTLNRYWTNTESRKLLHKHCGNNYL